jgi:hypothetical protein
MLGSCTSGRQGHARVSGCMRVQTVGMQERSRGSAHPHAGPAPQNPTQVQSTVPLDEPLFQPFPAEVVFAGYRPFEPYEATLTLRNNDKARGFGALGGLPAVRQPHALCLARRGHAVSAEALPPGHPVRRWHAACASSRQTLRSSACAERGGAMRPAQTRAARWRQAWRWPTQ